MVLFVLCCLLFDVPCSVPLLVVVCWWVLLLIDMFVACCVLFVVCCGIRLLSVAWCCLLFVVVCCALFVACCC